MRDEPEIGNMDKGIVERGKDSGDAEDQFTCWRGHLLANLALDSEQGRNSGMISPSRTCGPREMFSWAGRAVFFGGMVAVLVLLTVSW